MLFEELSEHRHENVDRVGRQPLRVAKQRALERTDRRMKRPVHLRAAIDEVQDGLGRHQRGEIFTISLADMRIGAVILMAAIAMTSCGGFKRQYEYEEELYVSLDGTGTLYVHSSLPALNALRGASFDARPNAPVDRDRL